MRKRYWVSIALLLLGLWLMDARTRALLINHGHISSNQNILKEAFSSSESKATASVESSSDENVKSKPDVAKQWEENALDCWTKIRSQVPSNYDFIQINRERLNSVSGEWFYRRDSEQIDREPHSSPQEKFFAALAKAGYLEGLKLQHQDDKEAVHLLEEVAHEDPQNSAPLLYAALIKKRHHDNIAASKLIERALQTKYFHSYLIDYVRQLYMGVENEADLISAMEIWSSTPVPNYLALNEIMGEHEELALQLMESGLKSKANPYELNWIPIEYAFGYSQLKKIGKAQAYPTWKKLYEQEEKSYPWVAKSGEKLFEKCELETVSEQVKELKSFLGAQAN